MKRIPIFIYRKEIAMVGSENTFIQFKGDGHTTVFEYPYDFTNADDLKVLYADADGVLRNVTTSTTIEGNKVKYPRSGDPIPVGGLIIVYRDTATTQTLDLPDKYPYDNIEKALDHIVYILQEHSREIGKSLRLGFGSSDKEFILNDGQVDFIKDYKKYRDELESLLNDTRNEHAAAESAKGIAESNRELAVNAMQVASEKAQLVTGKVADAEALFNTINTKLADADSKVTGVNQVLATAGVQMQSKLDTVKGIEAHVTTLTNQASTSATQATQMATKASDAISTVSASVNKAKEILDNVSSVNEVVKSKATEAATSAQTATNQAAIAKRYADQAQGVAGGDFATHAEVNAIKGDVANIKTQVGNDLTNRLATIQGSINGKANSTDVYNKATVDQKISQVSTSLSSNVSTLQSSINAKANTADVYNKSAVDAKLQSINLSTVIPVAAGQGGTPTSANGKVVFKTVTSTDAPGDGYVLEYGNDSSNKSQLYIGNTPSQGIYVGGWIGGAKEQYEKLATERWARNNLGVDENTAAALQQVTASYDQVNELLKKKDNMLIIDSIYRDDNVQIIKYTNGMMEYRVRIIPSVVKSLYKITHSFRIPFVNAKNLYAYSGFMESGRLDLDISPGLEELTTTTITVRSANAGYYCRSIMALVVGYWK